MHKTAKEQIVSGLQLGGSLGLFLIAGMLMGDGWSRVFDAANIHKMVGWTELALAAVILFFTAHVWLLLLGGIAMAGIFKSLFMVMTGTNLYPIHFRVDNPRRNGVEFLVYCVAILLLIFQFRQKKPTKFDRIALTSCVFFWLPAKGPEFSLWLAVGPLLLAVSWAFKTMGRRATVPD